SARLYCSCRLCDRCFKGYIQYFQKLVPDARRPVFFIADECLVPAAVYNNGRNLSRQPTFSIKEEFMKHKKTLILLILAVCILFCFSSTAFAAELTEAEVEQAVADQGEETVTGNIFIWFLCAIAFLKVSQKIDSF